MTRDEIKELFKRIKTNYSTFVVDDYKLNEWCRELKDYDLEDLHKKLEDHMRSEQYGLNEPKLYFLTKFLIKSKNKNNQNYFKTSCQICNIKINLEDYESHYHRCNSLEWLNKKSIEYFSKEIDKKKYMNVDEENFNDKYNLMINKCYNETKKEEEKKMLFNIINCDKNENLKDIKINYNGYYNRIGEENDK